MVCIIDSRTRRPRTLRTTSRQVNDHPREVHDAIAAVVSLHHRQVSQQGLHRRSIVHRSPKFALFSRAAVRTGHFREKRRLVLLTFIPQYIF